MARAERAPSDMKWVALAMAALDFVMWLYGGLIYSRIGNAEIDYWIGWAVLLCYLPLYLYRRFVEDPRDPGFHPGLQAGE